jgi:hypothetical protein
VVQFQVAGRLGFIRLGERDGLVQQPGVHAGLLGRSGLPIVSGTGVVGSRLGPCLRRERLGK